MTEEKKKTKTTTTNLGTYLSFVLLIGTRKQQNKQTQVAADQQDHWEQAPLCTPMTMGHPRTQLTFLISLLSLFLSAVGDVADAADHSNQLMPPQSERRSSRVPPAPQQTLVS